MLESFYEVVGVREMQWTAELVDLNSGHFFRVHVFADRHKHVGLFADCS